MSLATSTYIADLLICPACGADKGNRAWLCSDCRQCMPLQLKHEAELASNAKYSVRRRTLRNILKWARAQPGAPRGLDHDVILQHCYPVDEPKRFVVPERVAPVDAGDEEIGQRATTFMPDAELIEAAERAMRASALHLARAKAAIDHVGEMYLGQLRGEAGVNLTTPLSDAAAAESMLKCVNGLELAGIVTVGDLLDCFTQIGVQLPKVDNVGPVSVAALLATVLRRFVGGAPPVGNEAPLLVEHGRSGRYVPSGSED